MYIVRFIPKTWGANRYFQMNIFEFGPILICSDWELGGNDPAYVRPDADLKYVAENTKVRRGAITMKIVVFKDPIDVIYSYPTYTNPLLGWEYPQPVRGSSVLHG
jgi:hypothetical protein